MSFLSPRVVALAAVGHLRHSAAGGAELSQLRCAGAYTNPERVGRVSSMKSNGAHIGSNEIDEHEAWWQMFRLTI